ncbi:MAG TPA: hypothetical protein VF937_18040 [Chloroflexota bacterium]
MSTRIATHEDDGPLISSLCYDRWREPSVYAVVRRNTYDQTRLSQHRQQLDEFDALHARQPGFRGTISIQAGDGSVLVLNLWESKASAEAGLGVLRPVVQRLVEPLLATPSVLVAEGDVLTYDLATA